MLTTHWKSVALCALLASACGPDAQGQPNLPPPEYEEPVAPASAVPAQSMEAPPAPPPPNSDPTALDDKTLARDAAMGKRAAAYVDAFMDDGAVLASDKKQFIFRSTRDGLPQVYVGDIAKPDAPPLRLTTTNDRVQWVGFSPDEKSVLFLSDAGGDEHSRIFRVARSGGTPTLLTPGGEELSRDEPHFPRNKPEIFVYAATTFKTKGTKLFVQKSDGTDASAAKEVYADEGAAGVLDVSPDGAHVLLSRTVGLSERVLLDVDVAKGSASRVYPPEGSKALVSAGAYIQGGKHVVIASDEGGDTTFLLDVDVASGKIARRAPITDPKNASIVRLAISPRGDSIALGVNEGNVMSVRLVDAKTLTTKVKAKLPSGSASFDHFRADGGAFSVTLTAPEHPADVFSVDATTGVATPLRNDKRAGIQPMFAITEKVPAADGGSIPVNVYFPRGSPTPGKRLPTIVLVHGGPATNAVLGWGPCLSAGDELFCRPYAPFFVSLGYAIVEPNIRGSTGFGRSYEMADDRGKRGDALKDIETVNAWAKAEPWCDADRMVVFGSSYGGMMTLLALEKQPTRWRAGVDMFGVYDLRTLLASTKVYARPILENEFGHLDTDAETLRAWSPSQSVESIASPLFVYQGQNDPRVKRSESDALVIALRTRHIPVEYMVAPDEGHSLEHRGNRIELMSRVARFLGDELGVQ